MMSATTCPPWRRPECWSAVFLWTALAAGGSRLIASDLPGAQPVATPTAQQLQAVVGPWLASLPLAPEARQAVEHAWNRLDAEASGAAVVDVLWQAAVGCDAELAQWSQWLRPAAGGPAGSPSALPAAGWRPNPDWPSLIRQSLRLALGVRLALARRYDAAEEQLADLTPEETADPASLLFYRGVAHHQLLEREPALQDLNRLLGGVATVPVRYRAVAELIRDDLASLEDASLDHIARRMRDVERRLALGESGNRVLEVEDGVLSDLDKLIDELEQQQNQSSGGGAGSAGSTRPPQGARPADESRILGGSGPGRTDRRRLEDRGGWGDLPPKARGEALQQIGRDFPPHYREVVEQYFRRLAEGDAAPPSAPPTP